MKRFDIAGHLLSLKNSLDAGCTKYKIRSEDHTCAIEKIEDVILDNPNNILASEALFDAIQDIISCYRELTGDNQMKVVDLITSGFKSQIREMKQLSGLSNNYKSSLECYVFSIYSLLLQICKSEEEKEKPSSSVKSSKTSKPGILDNIKFLLLEDIRLLFQSLPIASIWSSNVERESFLSLVFLVCQVFFSIPDCLKNDGFKVVLAHAICFCIKYGTINTKENIKSTLCRYTNHSNTLCEFTAQIVVLSCTQYQLGDFVDLMLKEISRIGCSLDGSGQSETATAKNVASFLNIIVSSVPRDLFRSLSHLAEFLNCEPYALRCSFVEVSGSLIEHFHENKDQDEVSSSTHIKSLLKVLQERLRDVNAFVRVKVLQTVQSLLKNGHVPLLRRQHLVQLITDRLSDKAVNVRKKAIQLIHEFIRLHPFSIDGGELSLDLFKEKLDQIESQISSMGISISKKDDELDIECGEEPTQTSELLMKRKYYVDAIRFVKVIEHSLPIIYQLLASSSKMEVIECIDLIVLCSHYRVQGASQGIRKMVHLIWNTSATSNENIDDPSIVGEIPKSIKDAVLLAFKRIHLDVDPSFSPSERIHQIAFRLMELVKGPLNMAEIISIEEIFKELRLKKSIPSGLSSHLWTLFSTAKESLLFRKCAGLLLNMIINNDHNNSSNNNNEEVPSSLSPQLPSIQDLINVGLDVHCHNPFISRCSLSLIRKAHGFSVLPPDDTLFIHLSKLILKVSCDFCLLEEWLDFCQEAVRTIYALCSHPYNVMSCIIILLSSLSFKGRGKLSSMSMLFFVVGHLAVQQSSFLEDKHKKDKKGLSTPSKDDENGEYELVDGHLEVNKSKDFLYAEPLLIPIAETVVTVCRRLVSHIKHESKRKQPSSHIPVGCDTVFKTASMALGHMMMASSKFCRENLGLFLEMSVNSPIEIVRSNMAIILSDLALVQASLMDQNVHHLYSLLSDKSFAVRRNALMVLTHLILNGMIKAKGHLSLLACCIDDDDQGRISGLARLFFEELSKKDPSSIYNNLPDIISNLSADDALSEASYQKIMCYLMAFLKKEKHIENVVEKLCGRFRLTSSKRQWANLAFCLAQIPYISEKPARKLIEDYPSYVDKLYDDKVFSHFKDILGKLGKITKPTDEFREQINFLEQKMLEFGRTDGKNTQHGQPDPLLSGRVEPKSRPRASKKNRARHNAKRGSVTGDGHLDELDVLLDDLEIDAKIGGGKTKKKHADEEGSDVSLGLSSSDESG